jgi:hypothetical protein
MELNFKADAIRAALAEGVSPETWQIHLPKDHTQSSARHLANTQ